MRKVLALVLLLAVTIAAFPQTSNTFATTNHAQSFTAPQSFPGGIGAVVFVDATTDLQGAINSCPAASTGACYVIDTRTTWRSGSGVGGTPITINETASIVMKVGVHLLLGCGVRYNFTNASGPAFQLTSNSYLSGCGGNTPWGGGSEIYFNGATGQNGLATLVNQDFSDGHISDLRVTDGRATQGGDGIQVWRATNASSIRGVHVTGFNHGIDLNTAGTGTDGPNFFEVANSFITDSQQDCIYVNNATETVRIAFIGMDRCGLGDPSPNVQGSSLYGGIHLASTDQSRGNYVLDTIKLEHSTTGPNATSTILYLDNLNGTPVTATGLHIFQTTTFTGVGNAIVNVGTATNLNIRGFNFVNGSGYGSLVNVMDDRFSGKQYSVAQWGNRFNSIVYNTLTGSATNNNPKISWNGNEVLGERISVKGLGARGDGTTDDTTAIQAAIDACESAGSSGTKMPYVYFPYGIYAISSGLTWKNCSWRGDDANAGVRILWNGAAGATVVTKAAGSNSSFIGMYGLNYRIGTAIPGTWFDFNTNSNTADVFLTFDHIHLGQTSGDQMFFGNWVNLQMHHMRFDGAGTYAIHLQPKTAMNLSSFMLDDFTYDNNPSTTAQGVLFIDGSISNPSNLGTIALRGARIELNKALVSPAAIVAVNSNNQTRIAGIDLQDISFQDNIATNNTVVVSNAGLTTSAAQVMIHNMRQNGLAATLGGTWISGTNMAYLPASGNYSEYVYLNNGTIEETGNNHTFHVNSASTTPLISERVGTETNDRWNIDANGCMNMGPGGATATDIQVCRATNSMTINRPVQVGTFTVSGLPAASAASSIGSFVRVSDSTAIATEGQTCAGGGTTVALAFSNGTVWKCF